MDTAIAILTDERPNNTHPQRQRKSRASNTPKSSSSTGTTYVATKRKHSKQKA
ncbi:hypothetical protein [Acinetobacter pragensis]|uniref:hypothetical protein n=1 Tax=Acinetobacter pragensis TaxID=1806892 RepID=UPI0013733006|nr:hypothetical protein [Acinetobacter pragensis]